MAKLLMRKLDVSLMDILKEVGTIFASRPETEIKIIYDRGGIVNAHRVRTSILEDYPGTKVRIFNSGKFPPQDDCYYVYLPRINLIP